MKVKFTEFAAGSRMLSVRVVVSRTAFAFISVWFVDAIGESTAIVQCGIVTFVLEQQTFSARARFVWRLVNGI